MEIRQLEYFVVSAEENSFYKASQKLYTSQPAVSKAIALLEKDVNGKLFERSNRGLKLTKKGEKLYHYAKNILRQVALMQEETQEQQINLRIASYPSYMVAQVITEFYTQYSQELAVDYREGTVQDIIELIYEGIAEIGIVYISPNQASAFEHILAHKHLEFVPIKESELCVYVGKENRYYKTCETERHLAISELGDFGYIRGIRDFFSVEHHFDYVSLNEINTTHFKDKVLTNSDHLVSAMLEKTDLAYLGIDTKVRVEGSKISIASEQKRLTLGYIQTKSSILSDTVEAFLTLLKSSL